MIIFILIILGLLIFIHFFNRYLDYSTLKMAKEFHELWPNSCLICSYHAYGIREGFLKEGTPVSKHKCLEAKP